MDDNMMFDYLVKMGLLRPEQDEMKRKQAMIDMLRKDSMQAPEGQMIGKHYVAPSATQQIAKVMQGYGALMGQKGLDDRYKALNAQQGGILEELRRRRLGNAPGGSGWGMDIGFDTGVIPGVE
jgi:hypothetical protein